MVAVSADTATITQLSRNDTARIFQLWDFAAILQGIVLHFESNYWGLLQNLPANTTVSF
jgi:hypothetical protein